MRFLAALRFFFLSAVGPSFAADASFVDRVLTLEDSVRIAQGQSETVLSAREDVTIALQHVHQAEALFFPQLDLNANWNKFSVEGARPFLTQPQLGQTLIPANARPNYYTARVDIYQPIYEGGRLRTRGSRRASPMKRRATLRRACRRKSAARPSRLFTICSWRRRGIKFMPMP